MANPFTFLAQSYIDQSQGGCTSQHDHEKAISNKGKQQQDHLSGTGVWGDIDSFCHRYGCYNETAVEKLVSTKKDQDSENSHHQEQMVANLNSRSLLPNPTEGSSNSYNEVKRFPFSPACLEHLRNHSYGFNNFKKSKSVSTSYHSNEDRQKLSTEKILRLAGERFIEFSSRKFININSFMQPYGSSLSNLCSEDRQDIELAQLLLAVAEKVSNQQFDQARKLLRSCQWIASTSGTPVQRAVYYFAEALDQRIQWETGSCSPGNREEKETGDKACLKMKNILTHLILYQELPHIQAVQSTAVQTILEKVTTASKVHLIDLQIGTGINWVGLMQALAEQNGHQIICLKITALVTMNQELAEETGKRLISFASCLKLSFTYKVVSLSDLKDLKAEDLGIEPGEAVAVYASFIFRTLIAKPICLENLMIVIRRIDPVIMVVIEVEANHNASSFVIRFIEALFFYGAMFDSLEDTLARDNEYRDAIESVTFRTGIQNIVAKEGYDRVTRSVNLNVWRAFFARFGLVELALSPATLYQASLLVQQFASGKSCTLDTTTKSLLVGWKGTPFYSVSAWNFHS